MVIRQCENCRWWVYNENMRTSREGECHKRSPLPIVVNQREQIQTAVHWPPVFHCDFCGDFEAKENYSQLPEMIGIPDVAKWLHIDTNKVYRMAKSGELPAYKMHGTARYIFDYTDLRIWLESQKNKPNDKEKQNRPT